MSRVIPAICGPPDPADQSKQHGGQQPSRDWQGTRASHQRPAIFRAGDTEQIRSREFSSDWSECPRSVEERSGLIPFDGFPGRTGNSTRFSPSTRVGTASVVDAHDGAIGRRIGIRAHTEEHAHAGLQPDEKTAGFANVGCQPGHLVVRATGRPASGRWPPGDRRMRARAHGQGPTRQRPNGPPSCSWIRAPASSPPV